MMDMIETPLRHALHKILSCIAGRLGKQALRTADVMALSHEYPQDKSSLLSFIKRQSSTLALKTHNRAQEHGVTPGSGQEEPGTAGMGLNIPPKTL